MGGSAIHRFAVATLIVLAARAGAALAGDVGDLYQAQIPVASQAEAERTAALRAAFEAVLVKVTGRRDVGRLPRIQEALRQPIRYVQQYFYQPLPPAEAGEAQRNTQVLTARFDPQATDELIRQAGAPLWGRTRPTTLLWLAVQDGNDRYLVGGDAALSGSIQSVVDREAQRRGVPVLVPMMDLEDRGKLAFADVWGDFQEVVLKASDRYRASAVMVGRLLREAGGGWSARWSLYQEGAADQWSASSGQWQDLIAGGIDGAADILAQRFSRPVSAEGEKTAELVITNVRSLVDYDRALGYLRGLDGVQAVEVGALEGERLSVRLQLASDRASLVRLIGFGSTLARDAAGTQPASSRGQPPPADQELSYRLLP
jgi:hypothetical protein